MAKHTLHTSSHTNSAGFLSTMWRHRLARPVRSSSIVANKCIAAHLVSSPQLRISSRSVRLCRLRNVDGNIFICCQQSIVLVSSARLLMCAPFLHNSSDLEDSISSPERSSVHNAYALQVMHACMHVRRSRTAHSELHDAPFRSGSGRKIDGNVRGVTWDGGSAPWTRLCSLHTTFDGVRRFCRGNAWVHTSLLIAHTMEWPTGVGNV